MELRHLRYFVAVAQELNFRRAAERLRVAQPALSSQIKDLEFEIGARLLDRDTGGVRLTDAGAAFLEEAQLIVEHSQRAISVARETAQGRRGRLTIGYFAAIFMGLMPESLKAYREKFPGVDVMLVEMPVHEQIGALESGAIQIAFAVGGVIPVPAHIRNVCVARSPVRVVMHHQHRLARARRIAVADLANEPMCCITVPKAPASLHRDLMQRFFANHGVKPKPIREIVGVEAFRATLESGLGGVSLITESGSLSRSDHLVLKPLKETGPAYELELHALWRDDQTSQLTENFIAVMRATSAAKRRSR